MGRRWPALATLVAALALGCGRDAPPAGPRVRLPSGLEYQDLVVGTGEAPRAGQTVVVHYRSWRADGTPLDSSRDRAMTFEFPIGGGKVVRGFDDGVATMRAGGTRKLWIPPALAYGAQGLGTEVPPDTALVYEVELLYLR